MNNCQTNLCEFEMWTWTMRTTYISINLCECATARNNLNHNVTHKTTYNYPQSVKICDLHIILKTIYNVWMWPMKLPTIWKSVTYKTTYNPWQCVNVTHKTTYNYMYLQSVKIYDIHILNTIYNVWMWPIKLPTICKKSVNHRYII